MHKEKSFLTKGNSICKSQRLGRTGPAQLQCGCRMRLGLAQGLRALRGEAAEVIKGQGYEGQICPGGAGHPLKIFRQGQETRDRTKVRPESSPTASIWDQATGGRIWWLHWPRLGVGVRETHHRTRGRTGVQARIGEGCGLTPPSSPPAASGCCSGSC